MADKISNRSGLGQPCETVYAKQFNCTATISPLLYRQTTGMTQNSINPISPVVQFVLLLTPVVISCFFLVYSLTGWIIEGRDKLNWALEAPGVAMWVGAGSLIYSFLVMAYTRWKGAERYHVLIISSWGHILLAVLLTVSVFITVKL